MAKAADISDIDSDVDEQAYYETPKGPGEWSASELTKPEMSGEGSDQAQAFRGPGKRGEGLLISCRGEEILV
jgi:hypothetical protein